MSSGARSHVILAALALSLVVHVAVMYAIRPKVMTTVARGVARPSRHFQMRVTKDVPPPEPVLLEAVEDLKALKDAPLTAEAELKPSESTLPVVDAAKVLSLADPEPKAIPEPEKPVFDVRPLEIHASSSPMKIPMAKIEVPKLAPAQMTTPSARPAAALPLPAALASAGPNADSVFLPNTLPKLEVEQKVEPIGAESKEEQKKTAAAETEKKEEFKPVEEVLEKVDEKIVEAEKKEVRKLLDASVEAKELEPAVNATLAAATEGGWTYFKLMVLPRRTLEVVPKDVVVLLDGSGSIGNDRLASCRKAARRILRTATNSGDRFNLVVFRNRFSYAFRSWRPCDAASFEAGDRWLANQTAHGRTDVFSTISSVLTLPRDPKRPLIALVVTDGDANEGVSDTAEILSKFTALNDGLVSVYMYGVKSSANRELIDLLTHANRGEGFIFEGWRWNAGEGIDGLSERFRDPVLSDLRIVFAADCKAEAYPRLLRNLNRGDVLTVYGRVPAGTKDVAFSLKGLNGATAHEGYFRIPLATSAHDAAVVAGWKAEREIDAKLR